MDEDKVVARYDREADILYIKLKDGPIKDTVDVADDIFLECAEDDSIAGIEIWRARDRILRPLAKDMVELIKASSGSA